MKLVGFMKALQNRMLWRADFRALNDRGPLSCRVGTYLNSSSIIGFGRRGSVRCERLED